MGLETVVLAWRLLGSATGHEAGGGRNHMLCTFHDPCSILHELVPRRVSMNDHRKAELS